MQRSGGVSSGLLSVFREAQGRRLECSGVAFALHARGQRSAYFIYMIAEVAGGAGLVAVAGGVALQYKQIGIMCQIEEPGRLITSSSNMIP